MRTANMLAGAPGDSAVVEFGPGPATFEVLEPGNVAFGGAPRQGATWWETLEVKAGEIIVLANPWGALWSYLAIEGGVDSPLWLGSRSICAREGIGRFIGAGDVITSLGARLDPVDASPPSLHGPVRISGDLPGAWTVSHTIDRMGYHLEGEPLPPGAAQEYSEPVLPGVVQVLPSGMPIVLMAEGSTVGGYEVCAVVHSEDLRFVAQTPPRTAIDFQTM